MSENDNAAPEGSGLELPPIEVTRQLLDQRSKELGGSGYQPQFDEPINPLDLKPPNGGSAIDLRTAADIVTPSVAPILQDRDRVTLTGHIHYEHHGDEPHSINYVCSYFTETQGEVYKRRITVGQEWRSLPLGWFAEDDLPIGLIVIINQEGTIEPSTVPTEEEKADVEKRIIELRLNVGACRFIYIHPRLVFSMVLKHPDEVQLCCQHGEARCAIHIFPK